MRRKFGSISKNCLAAIMSASIMMSSVVAFPMTAMAGDYYLEHGSITVHATTGGQSVTQGSDVTPNDPTPVIHNDDPNNNVQCDQTSNTITIEADSGTTANVTLQDVNINTRTDPTNANSDGLAAVTVSGEGNVTIELNGDNNLSSGIGHAGVEDNLAGELTIKDAGNNGTLTANGGGGGAGIGSGNVGNGSDIIINGGTITANGGANGAGIGGGFAGDGINITINDGTVTAIGGNYGAGIGGGTYNDGSNITIYGGTVIATGGIGAAGIGGGFMREGTGITISGSARVSAAGGGEYLSAGAGAAIGGGGGYNVSGTPVVPDTSELEPTGSVNCYPAGTSIESITSGVNQPDEITTGTYDPASQGTGQQSQQTGEAGVASYSASVPARADSSSAPAGNNAFSYTQTVPPEDDAAFLAAANRQTDELLREISNLRATGKLGEADALIKKGLTIKAGTHQCFNKDFLETIGEAIRMGISITIDFIYKGHAYSVTIPGYSEFDPDSLVDKNGFCGPMNLLTVFG